MPRFIFQKTDPPLFSLAASHPFQGSWLLTVSRVGGNSRLSALSRLVRFQLTYLLSLQTTLHHFWPHYSTNHCWILAGNRTE